MGPEREGFDPTKMYRERKIKRFPLAAAIAALTIPGLTNKVSAETENVTLRTSQEAPENTRLQEMLKVIGRNREATAKLTGNFLFKEQQNKPNVVKANPENLMNFLFKYQKEFDEKTAKGWIDNCILKDTSFVIALFNGGLTAIVPIGANVNSEGKLVGDEDKNPTVISGKGIDANSGEEFELANGACLLVGFLPKDDLPNISHGPDEKRPVIIYLEPGISDEGEFTLSRKCLKAVSELNISAQPK